MVRGRRMDDGESLETVMTQEEKQMGALVALKKAGREPRIAPDAGKEVA